MLTLGGGGLKTGGQGSSPAFSGTVTALQFISTQASGSVGFQLNTAGARLKLSSGGTTDYFTSNGSDTIVAAGNLSCSSLSATTWTGQTGNLINLHETAGPTIQAGSVSPGVTCISSASRALIVTGNTSSPAFAAFKITPQDAEPTGASVVGDMYVTTAGVLKICTAAGTPGTWVSVGTQT